jgi:hypothetical protein
VVQLSRPGWRAVTAATALLAGLATLPSAPAAAGPGEATSAKPRVIADGLNNPRHLRWQHGSLYIAEAGTGGDGACIDGPEGKTCLGATGSITRVRNGKERRVVRGLPSLAPQGDEPGQRAIGPADVRVRGQRYTVALGLGANPQLRDDLGRGGRRLGTVSTGRLGDNRLRVLADVAAYEALSNPDGEVADGNPVLDTNPVALLNRGRRTHVVDAGGDALLRYRRNHDISTTAVFADVPDVPAPVPGGKVSMDAVPTAAAYGPDGAVYVSQLTGFPFPVGGARIWKVDRRTGAATVAFEGFTNIMDLAFDRRGRLLVLEIAHNSLLSGSPEGALWRVHGSSRERLDTPGQLSSPGGVDVGPRGEIYVTNNAQSAGEGQLLRVRP